MVKKIISFLLILFSIGFHSESQSQHTNPEYQYYNCETMFLDSIVRTVEIPNTKHVFTYDKNGNIYEKLSYYRYKPKDEWRLNEKAYYYFTNSDLIKRIDYYDTIFPAIVAGEEYFYYNNDSFKYKLEYQFNIANSNFDTITKVQHLYYPNGKIHKKIRFELDTSTNILDTVAIEEYLYHTNGKIEYKNVYELNNKGNPLEIKYKILHRYNNSNLITSKVKLEKSLNDWDSISFERYFYDSSGILIEMLQADKLICHGGGSFVSIYYGGLRSFIIYDSLGRLDFIHYITYNGGFSCFPDPTTGDSSFYRLHYSYDSVGNLVKFSYFVKEFFGDLVSINKTYNYNNKFKRNRLIIPYFVDDTLFNYQRVTEEQIVWSSRVTQKSYKDTFYYSKPLHFIQLPDIYVCQGDSVKKHGKYFKTEGVHQIKYLNQFNCDSIYEFNLKIKPTYELMEYDSVCVDDSLFWRGEYYSSLGIYYKNYKTFLSCDSTFVLNLKIIQPPKSEQIVTNPVNGILKDGGLGEIILPRTDIYNSYYTATDSLQYSGIYSGNGVHLSLGNFYQEGTYGIWAFKSNSGCKAKIGEVSFINFSDLNFNDLDEIINLYPNPTTGQFTLQISNLAQENLSITIYDTKGKVVYSENINETETEFIKDINLSQQQKGVYIVNVQSKGKSWVKKLVVY